MAEQREQEMEPSAVEYSATIESENQEQLASATVAVDCAEAAIEAEELSDQFALNTGTVGLWLSRARQSKGLSIDEVAKSLRLSPRIIQCLEEDAFEQLGRVAFIRGYLRSYARHLNLRDDVIIHSFNQLDYRENPYQPSVKMGLSQRRIRKPGKRRWSRWLTLSLATVILTLAVVWWYQQTNHFAPSQTHFVSQLTQSNESVLPSSNQIGQMDSSQPAKANDEATALSLQTETSPFSRQSMPAGAETSHDSRRSDQATVGASNRAQPLDATAAKAARPAGDARDQHARSETLASPFS